MGLIKQDNGQILVDGISLDIDKTKLKIGYVPQSNFLLNDSIKKNIALGVNDNDIDLKKFTKQLNYQDCPMILNIQSLILRVALVKRD